MQSLAHRDYEAFESLASVLANAIGFSIWGNDEDELNYISNKKKQELLQAGRECIVTIEQVYDLVPQPEDENDSINE